VHLSFSGEGLLDGSVKNYDYDEAGNITMVTTVTDAGTDVDDAWGTAILLIEAPEVADLSARFVGRAGLKFDSLTGLYYSRKRWYSALLHRFMSRDPIGLRGSLNLYRYCNNSPLKYVDPSGLKIVTVEIYLDSLVVNSGAFESLSRAGLPVYKVHHNPLSPVGDDTYTHQFKVVDALNFRLLGNVGGGDVVADSDPKAAGEFRTLFYNGSFKELSDRYISAHGETGGIELNRIRYNGRSNTVLHELGHILSGIKHGPDVVDAEVMDTGWLQTYEAYHKIGVYDDTVINASRARLACGDLKL